MCHPPADTYPFAFVFTAGPPPSSLVAGAVYVPQVLVQLNQYFNLIVLPFEIVLGVVLSSLVAATIIITLYVIRDSSKHSCMTGATVSGLGGFFGFTATCPTCLVPTLISVLFGGVSSTVPSLYSHLAGVILPPLVSIAALSVGLTILDFQAKQSGHTVKSLVSIVSRKIISYLVSNKKKWKLGRENIQEIRGVARDEIQIHLRHNCGIHDCRRCVSRRIFGTKPQPRQQQSVFLRTARALPKTTSWRYQLHHFLHCRYAGFFLLSRND